jgi:hypothetical protein
LFLLSIIFIYTMERRRKAATNIKVEIHGEEDTKEGMK